MKILALAPRPIAPVRDGGTVATASCLTGLAAAGASVTLLSMKTQKHRADGADYPAPPLLAAYHTVDINTEVKASAMLNNLLFSGKPYDLQRFCSRRYMEALSHLIKSNSYDLIHCEGLPFALYIKQIKKLTKIPVVLRAHNLEHRIREMTAARTASPIRRAYLNNLAQRLMRLEQRASEMFDAIIPISMPDYSWFSAAAAGRPVWLCETGVESTALQPWPDEEGLRVGFIGSMDWQPNLEGVIWLIEEVWPQVKAQVPEATLQIAGKGMSRAAGKIPGGNGVIMRGEPDDAASFIASNHIMAVPLFAGSGLRIRIIESMAAGRPVVATRVAAEGIAAQHDGPLTMADGALTVADDAVSFAAALISLLSNKELREGSAAAAVELVNERYDNTRVTAGLMKFYRELINNREVTVRGR